MKGPPNELRHAPPDPLRSVHRDLEGPRAPRLDAASTAEDVRSAANLGAGATHRPVAAALVPRATRGLEGPLCRRGVGGLLRNRGRGVARPNLPNRRLEMGTSQPTGHGREAPGLG